MKTHHGAKKRFFCTITPNVDHVPHIPPRLPDGSDGDIMQNLDDNIGKLMKSLDDENLAKDTLLIYMTDNGPEGVKSRKQLRGSKNTVYEGGTRVPCLMRWTGHIQSDTECTHLTGHIDLFPTLAELAGFHVASPGAQSWDGRSLVPLMENSQAEWASRHWISHIGRWGELAKAEAMPTSIRNQRYKLVLLPKGNELYDLNADLREQTNIITHEPKIAAELQAVHAKWWRDVQPYLVNDIDQKLPKESKPFHELYRRDFGSDAFDGARKAMTWSGGKPGPKKKPMP
jgi:arylsulfatase